MVDKVFEPMMKAQNANLLTTLFGTGKGSGAACLFSILAVSGVVVCFAFRRDSHMWKLEKKGEGVV